MRLIQTLEEVIRDFQTKTGFDPTIIYIGFQTYKLLSLEFEAYLGRMFPKSLKVVPEFKGIKYEILKNTPHHIGVGIEYVGGRYEG